MDALEAIAAAMVKEEVKEEAGEPGIKAEATSTGPEAVKGLLEKDAAAGTSSCSVKREGDGPSSSAPALDPEELLKVRRYNNDTCMHAAISHAGLLRSSCQTSRMSIETMKSTGED